MNKMQRQSSLGGKASKTNLLTALALAFALFGSVTVHAGQAAATFVNPQPDVPYLPKPSLRPANWLVEHEPVTPDASPEARALLKFLYSISTKKTLTGQHNYAANQGRFTATARQVTTKIPAMYGTDWGSGRGEIGPARDVMIQSIIKEYRKGSVITLCWHELNPKDDEPATFQQSVQSKLTDAEFNDVITPGTELNKRWLAQIDLIAGYMKQLRDARIPILFRPYHEMNGDWFWWGARRGERGTKQIYRMMFDRYVNHHKLNNLLWVWNVDRPEREDRQFVDYFPGQQYVDVLALDTYQGYLQSYYDDLNALSDGKVLAVSECGANVPPLDIFERQPKWAFYMIWSGFIGGRGGRAGGGPGRTPPAEGFPAYVTNPRMYNLDDAAYLEAYKPVLAASGFPPAVMPEPMPAPAPTNAPASTSAPTTPAQ